MSAFEEGQGPQVEEEQGQVEEEQGPQVEEEQGPQVEEEEGPQVEEEQQSSSFLDGSRNEEIQLLPITQSSETITGEQKETPTQQSQPIQVSESSGFQKQNESLVSEHQADLIPTTQESGSNALGNTMLESTSEGDKNCDNKSVRQDKKRVNKNNDNTVEGKRYRFSGFSMASTMQFLMESSKKETVEVSSGKVQENIGHSIQASSEFTQKPVVSETEVSTLHSENSQNSGQREEISGEFRESVTDIKQEQVITFQKSHNSEQREEMAVEVGESITEIKQEQGITFQKSHNSEQREEMAGEVRESITEIKQEQMEYSTPSVYTDDLSYDLQQSSVPLFISEAQEDFQQSGCDNFLRGCKWSPDGSSIVANSNDNKLRLYHLDSPMDSKMTSSLIMKEGSQIYDFAWLPQISCNDPDKNKIACTCSGIPVHLWNCNTGKVEASFKAFDQYDEVTAACSICFSLDSRKLYAGYERTIRVFDTEYPNKYCKAVKTFDSKRKEGQTGIISCFAMSPDNNGLYVAGSYSRHIGIYDSACDKLVCLMQGQRGGVTHLMFSPDANKLYSGGRKDAEILCWDMRNTGKILFSVLRDVKTNQRMYFDISQSGRYLTSGNHDGSVTFWDTLTPSLEEINGEMFLKPCAQFQAHRDCVNGVSFNHQQGMLATASGQRHFESFHDYTSDDSDNEVEAVEEQDFSLKLWTLPKLTHAMQ